uniref:Uncharacterized protein n=1 Tax=Arundo donax TaxID=35708 RepID=A0A0A9GNE1_ARUDO
MLADKERKGSKVALKVVVVVRRLIKRVRKERK